MEGAGLIQDLAIVLLAAAAAAALCRRLGLSVIVGYLVAGLLVGPHTPPFSLVLDAGSIQALSQVGLVFLMFGIGLGLSLRKLAKLGSGMLVATVLGALLVLFWTRLLGLAAGWSATQALHVAAMFMVSSSAVIAKMVGELHLTHERAAQRALGVTVLEDVLAVILLTVLGARTVESGWDIGRLLGGLTAFVVLLVGAGLLTVPRLMRRLEGRADPELQSLVVAGLLFVLALAALRAGYSLALGAFLLGAIVAEIPQRHSVERAFAGFRDVFSAVFFVSIGMTLEVGRFREVWPWVLGMGGFVLVIRPVSLCLALVAGGTPLREAQRSGLLLGPLGEFTFIIAQLGVAAAVLPAGFYPVAVGVSVLTVLVVPVVNRFAEPLLALSARVEPAWIERAVAAYHGWLRQLQGAQATSGAWGLIRRRLPWLWMEVLFVSGLLLFAPGLQAVLGRFAGPLGLSPAALAYAYWSAVTLVALVPLVALWRNIDAMAMIYAESVESPRLPFGLVHGLLRAAATVVIAFWLYAAFPLDALGGWGWLAVGALATLVVGFCSRRLVFWHSQWQDSVRTVLASREAAEPAKAAVHPAARELDGWNIRLSECVVPDRAAYAGQTLAELAIPGRFGCAVLEIERNGIVITALRTDSRVYPGDRLLLLGEGAQIAAANAALQRAHTLRDDADAFRGSILDTTSIPEGPRSGQTLAELNIGQITGARVVGIDRGGRRLIAPNGQERLHAGDQVLAAGTLEEIAAFRKWLSS